MCRQLSTPAANATPVTVWRPTQRTHPTTRQQNVRYVGAVKHGTHAAARGANVSGSMSGGTASSKAAALRC